MNIPANITVNDGGPERYDLECTICKTGMGCGPRFGVVSGSVLAATFIVQHATHDKKGNPSGLTPGGKARPAALAVIEP